MAVQCASVLPGLVFDEKSSLSHRWEMMRAPEAGSARRAGEDGAGAGGALELSRGDSRSFAARAEPAAEPERLLSLDGMVFEFKEEEQGRSIEDVWKNIQEQADAPPAPAPEPRERQQQPAAAPPAFHFVPQHHQYQGHAAGFAAPPPPPAAGVSTIPSLPPLLNSQSLDLFVLQQQLQAPAPAPAPGAERGNSVAKPAGARRRRRGAMTEEQLKASMHARIMKNRESAKRSRLRRQEHTAALERQQKELEAANAKLRQLIREERMAQAPRTAPPAFDILGRRTMSL